MRIGLIVGREETFPQALIERINDKQVQGVTAELVRLGGTSMDETIPYRVIVDRMSHEIPYYRMFLKKAVADGVIVINNPFWWTADDKFFECVLAQKLGVAVPRTVVLPNKSYDADLIDASFRNMIYPVPWEEHVAYTGLPAVLKPAIGGGWKNVSIVHSIDELIRAYDQSGTLQMILQEFIQFENYARCYVLGRRHVRVMKYDPTRPHAERYITEGSDHFSPELHDRIVRDCLTLCHALGYDMNTIEFAIRDGTPYAIDFLNPAPDMERTSVKEANFEWVVETMANLCIEYALGEETPVGQSAEAANFRWHTMINAAPVQAER